MSEVTVRGCRATTHLAKGEVATVERTAHVEAMIAGGYAEEITAGAKTKRLPKKAAATAAADGDLRAGSAASAQESPAGGERSSRAGG